MLDLYGPGAAPGDPGRAKYEQDMWNIINGIPRALTHLAPGFISQILSSPNAQGVEKFIPNVANGLYSTVDLAQNLIGKGLLGTDAHLPGAERAQELYDQRLAPGSVAALIPQTTPANPIETKLNSVADAAGSMGPFIGRGAMSTLPRAAELLSEFAFPGTVMKSAPVIGGGIDAGVQIAADQIDKANQAQAATENVGPPPNTSILLPDQTTQSFKLSAAEAAPSTVQPSQPTTVEAAPITTDAPDIPFEPVAPTFDPNTGWTWGGAILTGAGILTLMAARNKWGESIVNKVMGERAARYEKISKPFNSALEKINTGQPEGFNAGLPEAPLPGAATSKATELKTQFVDKNATLSAYAQEVAPSKTVGEWMKHEFGMYNNDHAFHSRFQMTMETGLDPVTGHRMPSPYQHFKNLARLSPDRQQLYSDARHALDELDNRLSRGATVGLTQWSTPELQRIASAGRADPEVNRLLNEATVIHDRLTDILVDRKMLTPAEAQNLKSKHRNYLSNHDMSGIIDNPLEARALGYNTGKMNANIPAWELDKQHYESLYRSMELNKLRAETIQAGLYFQDTNKNAAKVFQEWRPGAPLKPGERVEVPHDVLPVRINGDLRYFRVHNSALREALRMSPTALGTHLGIANQARQLIQSTITGLPAALTGRWFAPINAIRSATEISMIRPEGMAGGYLDKLIQFATRDHVAFRGDPTAIPTLLREVIAGTGAEFSRGLANMLHPTSQNVINLNLRQLLGDNAVNALHSRLQYAWENSIRGEMQRVGAMNAGGYSATPVPTGFQGHDERVFSAINNMVPELFRPTGFFGPATPYMIKLNELAHTMNSIIAEAGHEQFFRLNKGKVAPNKLAYETRQATGDPGTHGASNFSRVYNATALYGNVFVQEIARVARAFREAPIATATGLSVGLGIPHMIEVFSALLSGQDAVDHLQNLTNSEAAGNIYFYVPGRDPKDAIAINLPQGLRAFSPVVRQVLLDGLGVVMALKDDDIGSMIRTGLADFFSKHITQSTVDRTMTGASQFLSPPMPIGVDLPPSILMGRSIDPSLDRIYRNARSGDISKMTTTADIVPPGMPGVSPTIDPLFETQSGRAFQSLVTSLLGIAGQNMMQMALTGKNAWRDGLPPDVVIGRVTEDWRELQKKNLPMGNALLWDANNPLAARTPLINRTDDALRAIKPLSQFKSDLKNIGLTRSRGQVVDMPVDPKISPDPQMAPLIAWASKVSTRLDQTLVPRINDTKKQIEALRLSSLPPTTVTDMRNTLLTQLRSQYDDVAGILTDLNMELSKIVGKQVDVTRIDWSRGIDQFD